MTRRTRWAAVVLGLIAAGCENGTRTLQTARPVDSAPAAKAGEEFAQTKPDKSDPKAVELVTAALAAHTGNKPELLQKLKAVHFTRDTYGTVGGTQPAKSKWDVYAAWPDRLRQQVEMPAATEIKHAVECRKGDDVWLAVGGEKQLLTPEQQADFRIDGSAEWLWMLFPLTEPGTVLAPAPDGKVGGRPAAGVRVWAAGVTDAVLYFDKETKLLAGMTFDGRDGGQRVVKDVHVLGNRSYDGITLPERMALKANGRDIAEWTMPTLEYLSSVEPKLFEKP